jgi:hypothetical protein
MRRSTKVWVIAAVILILVGAGGYVYAQYRFSQRPSSLVSIPEYAYGQDMKGSSYSIDDLAPRERKYAETALHQFVPTVVACYHITEQRFFARKGGFTWDAIRGEVGAYLIRTFSSYGLEDSGQTPESDVDIAYLVWRRSNRLQRLFDHNVIVAAALVDPIRPAPAAEQIHVYGYFELAPN